MKAYVDLGDVLLDDMEELACIKWWLEQGRPCGICPFMVAIEGMPNAYDTDCRLCVMMFPEFVAGMVTKDALLSYRHLSLKIKTMYEMTGNGPRQTACPCYVFHKDEVFRRAKKRVEYLEQKLGNESLMERMFDITTA